MRVLENKTIEIALGSEKQKITYAGLVKNCCENIPQGGLSLQEQKERIKILSIADKAKEEMLFEEAQANKLKELVSAMRWAILSQEIIDFCDAVEGMKEVEMKKV